MVLYIEFSNNNSDFVSHRNWSKFDFCFPNILMNLIDPLCLQSLQFKYNQIIAEGIEAEVIPRMNKNNNNIEQEHADNNEKHRNEINAKLKDFLVKPSI